MGLDYGLEWIMGLEFGLGMRGATVASPRAQLLFNRTGVSPTIYAPEFPLIQW